MNYGGDAAEQVVRMSLEGVEVAAKISGNGAKNIALLLAAVLKEEQKTKGKARLTNMLKSGKELKVYTVQNQDLKKFAQEAKRYGVLYCVLKDKNNKSDTAVVDVIARAEDASKIQRITERFQLATVDTATVMGGVKSVPFPAKTEKGPLSEPNLKQENRSSGSMTGLSSKPSVKEKLDKYKDQATVEKIKAKSEKNIAEKIAEHTPPLPKVNGKER